MLGWIIVEMEMQNKLVQMMMFQYKLYVLISQEIEKCYNEIHFIYIFDATTSYQMYLIKMIITGS